MKKYKIVFSVATVLVALNLSACTFDRLGPPAPVAKPGINPKATGYLTVQSGDTLDAIATRYGLNAEDIATVNRLTRPFNITAGQRLALPYPVQYQVKEQDTLFSIARMFGLNVEDLASFNNMNASSGVKLGQMLKIPGGGPAGAPMIESSFKTFTIEEVEPLPPQKLTPVEVEELKSSKASPVKAEPVFAAGTPASQPAPVKTAAAPRQPKAAASGYKINENDPIANVLTALLQQEAEMQSAAPAAAPAVDAKEVATAKPAVATTADTKPKTLAQAVAARPESIPVKTTLAPSSKQGFNWPVRGKIISSYGAKAGKMFNDGVNIAAPRGTPVLAASDGVVAYVGNDIASYGNIVLVRHNGGLMTAYAHMNSVSVKKGSQIKRGQALGTVGSTGKVANSQLHFEIRQGRKSLDPGKFLGAAS